MIGKIKNKIMKMEPNRIWRPVKGGKSLDILQRKENPQISQFTEEWVASDVLVANATPESKQGISFLEIDGDRFFLDDIIKQDPEFFLGKEHCNRFCDKMEFLVKIIDCSTRLTLQVHPTKEQAKKYLNSNYGKTEAWYILSCCEDESFVYLGFKEDITKEKFIELFHKNNIKELENSLHKIPVKGGELFFLEAGIPHAMGAGIFFLEANEPSDITLRFEKNSPSGDKFDDMSIHAGFGYDSMFEIYDYTPRSKSEICEKLMRTPEVYEFVGGYVEDLLSINDKACFGIYTAYIDSCLTFKQNLAYSVAVVLSGKGIIYTEGDSVSVKSGDELFIVGSIENFTVENKCSSLKIVFFRPPLAIWNKNSFL